MALIQAWAGTVGSGTSLVLAFVSNTTAASLLLAAVASGDSGAVLTNVTDSQSATWVTDRSHVQNTAILAALTSRMNAAGGALTVTANFSASVFASSIALAEHSGMATSSAVDQVNSAGGFSLTPNSGNITTTVAGDVVVGVTCASTAGDTFSAGSLANERIDNAGNRPMHVQDTLAAAVATYANSSTKSGSNANWAAVVVSYKAAIPTLDQEGYRWRADDGSESAASWIAAQDTNITRAANLNTRLRMLVNASGDPATHQYQLEWREVGGIDWRKVTTGTLTGSVDIPVVLGSDDAQQVGTTMTLTGTTIGASLDATTDWAGMRFTNVQIPKGSTVTSAVVSVVPSASTEDEPLVTVFCEAADNSSTFTTGASNISNRSRTTGASWSSTDLGANGTTYFDSVSIVADVQAVIDRAGWAQGNPITVIIHGGATTTRDLTIVAFENAANQPPHLKVSFNYPAAAFALAASANIAASGANTTVQLSAPAGKATSDFVVGRVQDDENPADTVDITADDYTEMEWCLAAASAVVAVAEVYEFRVTSAGVVLDTYTVTPTFTIGAAFLPPRPIVIGTSVSRSSDW